MDGVERGEPAERFEYVFGDTVAPDTWDEADEDERAVLVEKRFGARDDAQRMLRTVVVTQLLAGDPPGVWSAARRLDDLGLDVEKVINQLVIVLSQTVREAIGPLYQPTGEADATDAATRLATTLAARLDRLPLPSPGEIEDGLVETTASAGVIAVDELVALVQARFAGWADDPLLADLVERALDVVLGDEEGPLVPLPGDDVGHAERLRDGMVLTHVLDESERSIGALTVSFDLAGFGRVPDPSFDGEPLSPVSAEPGHVAWMGDDGWLERFAAGTTVAVRVGADGTVQIDPLPSPPPVEPELVTALLDAYHRLSDEPGLPVSGEELAFAMLAADRGVFQEARAPLGALCEAAGLERRASLVAHDPDLWANLGSLQRAGRIHAGAHGDHELAHDVLAILDLADDLVTKGERGEDDRERMREVREAFDALDDLQVLNLVCDELFHDDFWPERAGSATALVDDLLHLARRPDDRALAHYLAARAAEIGRDLPAAERHLRLAGETGTDHVLAVDRLGWYASDRGDAARAVRLWRRCPPNRLTAVDLATVEPFAAESRAGLGRNQPCWCGSGRKYKQCHLGASEAPALADRVAWLYRKAAGYLDRSGPAARDAIVDVIAGLVVDDDPEQVLRALEDPLVTDLVLTEGGWFRRFLAARGPLLPDDEALLAAAWATVDRTVYEVVDVGPGAGVTVRDLRTGDTLDVRERSFSTTATTGTLVCARAVPDGPDGGTHQLVGGVRPVPPGREVELLDLLEEGEPHQIAAWLGVGAGARPPLLLDDVRSPVDPTDLGATRRGGGFTMRTGRLRTLLGM